MKLHKFKQNLNIIFSLFIGLIIGYFLFGNIYILYEKKKDSIEEPYYAYYVNNTSTREMPNKNSGLTLDTAKSSCTSGVTISWNDNNWQAILDYNNYQKNSTTRTKCTLYFKKKPVPTATTFLNNLVSGANKSSTNVYTVPNKTSSSCTYTLAYDGTSDSNLRYVGANPCNYVTFNGEKAGWRIIGILNTPEGKRIKLVRANSIGEYVWDNKAKGTGSSVGNNGSNDWTDSALKNVLNNGAYYNKTSGTCPSDPLGATTSCNFTSNGLTEVAKNQIDTITWKLGAGSVHYSYEESSDGLTKNFYTYERGTIVDKGRPTEWKGKIGLMYPSDYGYATSGGSTRNRNDCLAQHLSNWVGAQISYGDCHKNDWLFSSGITWTLTPFQGVASSNLNHRDAVFVIYRNINTDSGEIYTQKAAATKGNVYPSLYLKSSTTISSGEGTPENPYVLSGN